jgi:N-methylhydantoinase A
VTNAILEEKGARAALITTRGFRDVLELRRSARANLYDLFQDAPATLIPRRRRFEISERIGADGKIVTPLAESEIDELIADLKSTRIDAIAISLVFSFLNPLHERKLGARLRASLPDVPVYLSFAALLASIEPCLPSPAECLPTGRLHEIKHVGDKITPASMAYRKVVGFFGPERESAWHC